MRLLELLPNGNISLIDISPGEQLPPYAILSHMWGKTSEEVSFEEMEKGIGPGKAGWDKLRFCGQQAARDGLRYFWADTCCIKKSDASELSESIISMYRWYGNAERCYVYLSDVSTSSPAKKRRRDESRTQSRWEEAFRSSRWFTRGWTLQELLAPSSVEFFSKEGERLGDKRSLEQQIHDITAIPILALRGEEMSHFPTEKKFAWAKKRKTTRAEDLAYCLLGIFGVSMPVLYGEGKENANRRLRKEVDGFALDKEAVEKTHQDQVDLTRVKMLDWISPSGYPAQQSDIIKRRQEGTGHWFLEAPEVAQWVKKARSTLFCPGIPGAGKTMIAAIAIDHLLELAREGLSEVAFIYCNYKAQADQDVSSMLAAIIKQLAQGRPTAVRPVERLHQKHADIGTKPSLSEIYDVLKEVLTHCSITYIVIDALDECQHDVRHNFLHKVRELQTRHNVHIMTTSRFVPDIENAFKDALRLEVRASEEDVDHFVAGQIGRMPACIRREIALQELVRKTIAEAVDGMFLLARLHTDSLVDKMTARDVKSTLARLKRGSAALEDAYSEALRRIQGQPAGYRKLATNVLSWITVSRRPLTTAEICCALAVEPGEAEFDPENMPHIEDLVSVCAGLVVVDQESALVRLVHYTTQEYFERTRSDWDPDGQLRIATVCLTYLSMSVFEKGACDTDEEFEERLIQNTLLNYAAKHGGEHVRSVGVAIASLACSFVTKRGPLLSAAQVLYVPEDKHKGYSNQYPVITGLHWIARFGVCDVAKELLHTIQTDEKSAVNAKDSHGYTGLMYAAQYGHYDMTELLLDKGADVNAQGGQFGGALQAASWGGNERVVKLLLDKGADIHAQGNHGNALQTASEEGHEHVVRLLLDKGADVNARGGPFDGALPAASWGGHEQVVKLLLNNGADVNALDEDYGFLHERGPYYGGALQAASWGGNEQIVKLLLDKGADVNTQAGYFGNALQTASIRGYKQIVKLLLKNGANVNAQCGIFDSALQAAAWAGHKQVVKLLLKKGANINMEGPRFSNALQNASLHGHKQVVKLLLDRGANVNARGKNSNDALQAASYGGHKQVVKLLLDRGANVNAQSGMMGNALFVAVARSHEQVVELLLDKGADANAQDASSVTALQVATARGHEGIAKLLLDHGADRSKGRVIPKPPPLPLSFRTELVRVDWNGWRRMQIALDSLGAE